jgi:hypothetical protein
VARHRLKVARPLYPIVLRTQRFELVVAQEVMYRSRLVVQGVYSNLRNVATLCDELASQLHNEVAEIRNRDKKIKATFISVAFIFCH